MAHIDIRRTPNANLFKDADFWIGRFRESILSSPFKSLTGSVGQSVAHISNVAGASRYAAFWTKLALTPDEYQRIDLPVLDHHGSL